PAGREDVHLHLPAAVPDRLLVRVKAQVDPVTLDGAADVRGDGLAVAGDVQPGAQRDDGRIDRHHALARPQPGEGVAVRPLPGAFRTRVVRRRLHVKIGRAHV